MITATTKNTLVMCKNCNEKSTIWDIKPSIRYSNAHNTLHPQCPVCNITNSYMDLNKPVDDALQLIKSPMVLSYIFFGSHDSADIDVMYVYDTLPPIQECKKLATMIKDEHPELDLDPNFMTVRDGVVTSCYKGTVDEVNNMILYTYKYHNQRYHCPVKYLLKRDISVKTARVLRGVLSYISRSKYRTIIKDAMRGDTQAKINALECINLNDIGELNNPKYTNEDYFKLCAFQIGQLFGLYEYKELYTKKDIIAYMPHLEPYLNRDSYSWDNLDQIKHTLLSEIKSKYPGDLINNVTE